MFGDDPSRSFLEAGGHRLHYQWVGEKTDLAPLVFLHEGLGSVELWRDFPQTLCQATGRMALVYSRYGNGWSDPLESDRQPTYMHEEAEVLVEVLAAQAPRPPILVGHSDGASIAMIYAGHLGAVAALVLISPHVFVEPETFEAIDALRVSFPGSEMEEKMSKYHRDPQATFWGWNDIWLDDQFQSWNLEGFLPGVKSPSLLIQGEADEFGTWKQLDAIGAQVAGPVRRMLVAGAAHSPHLSAADVVLAEVTAFLEELG